MKKICRLSIAYAQTDTDGDMQGVLQRYMNECGVTMADIEVETNDTYGKKTHFGNWVLTPVLDNDAVERLAKSMGTQLDMHRFVLEVSDIGELAIGDRVTVQLTNMIAAQYREHGRVHRRGDDWMEVLKKRSQSKGWSLRAGDEAGVWKGWVT